MSRGFGRGRGAQDVFTGTLGADHGGGPFRLVSVDEVESLTAARAGAMSGTEPSDALRVSRRRRYVDWLKFRH